MQIFSSLPIVALIISCAFAQLDEVDVIRSEMDDSMEKYAVGSALVLLSSEKEFSVVASKLNDLMNTKYGKQWITLIGTNLHTTIIGMNLVNSTMLLMEYRSNHVLLVQQSVEHVDNSNKVRNIQN